MSLLKVFKLILKYNEMMHFLNFFLFDLLCFFFFVDDYKKRIFKLSDESKAYHDGTHKYNE